MRLSKRIGTNLTLCILHICLIFAPRTSFAQSAALPTCIYRIFSVLNRKQEKLITKIEKSKPSVSDKNKLQSADTILKKYGKNKDFVAFSNLYPRIPEEELRRLTAAHFFQEVAKTGHSSFDFTKEVFELLNHRPKDMSKALGTLDTEIQLSFLHSLQKDLDQIGSGIKVTPVEKKLRKSLLANKKFMTFIQSREGGIDRYLSDKANEASHRVFKHLNKKFGFNDELPIITTQLSEEKFQSLISEKTLFSDRFFSPVDHKTKSLVRRHGQDTHTIQILSSCLHLQKIKWLKNPKDCSKLYSSIAPYNKNNPQFFDLPQNRPFSQAYSSVFDLLFESGIADPRLGYASLASSPEALGTYLHHSLSWISKLGIH